LPSATAVVVVLAAAVTPAVLRVGNNQRRVAAIAHPTEPTTTSTEPPAETTTSAATTVTTGPVPPPTSPTTSIVPRHTTTTALVCRNSYDPRCGPFRWDPDPGPNEPSTAQVTSTPANPRVGDQVVFHVTFSNPDGPADSCEVTTGYGDGVSSASSCSVLAPPGGCKTPYGPWTPPARKADTVAFDIPRYSYKAAGTYTVTVSGAAGLDPCNQPTNPYRDPKSASTTITVSQ